MNGRVSNDGRVEAGNVSRSAAGPFIREDTLECNLVSQSGGLRPILRKGVFNYNQANLSHGNSVE